MRLIDIFEEKLDEVNMSPGALADFAKTPFAQAMTAGFEAELVVPNAQSDDDDGEQEPDYDQDERCTSTSDIRDFFQGDYNGRRQVDRAIEEIDEKFYEYADEQIMNEFENEKDEMIRQYLKDDGKTETEIEEIMDDESLRRTTETEELQLEVELEVRWNLNVLSHSLRYITQHISCTQGTVPCITRVNTRVCQQP
jgi:hypothetical protein